MSSSPFLAYVRGLPETPSVIEINIRSGPNASYSLLFKAPVGTANLPVMDVKADDKGANFQGKVYNWMLLQFPNGQSGWARDDLLEVGGDGMRFGYGVVYVRTFAFALVRQLIATTQPPPPAPVAPAPIVAPQSAAPVPAAPPAPIVAPVGVVTQPPAPSAPPASPFTVLPSAPVAPAAPVAAVGVVTQPPAPAVPVAPAAPAVPAVPVAPAAPAAPTPGVPQGAPTAIIKTQGAANTRVGPGSSFNRTGITLPRHGRYPLLEVQREAAGQQYRWFKLNQNGQFLWIREDLVTYEGDTTALGLPADLYPSPMKENYWWVRGWNIAPNKDATLPDHDGWDQGAATGEPMYCGPKGGLVVKSFQCVKCTADRPSTLMNGYSLGDPAIYTDPGWGNGYGNYIIVRYTNDLLPVSTRDVLAARGFAGGHIFVMYAHLNTRLVETGTQLAPGQQISTCGNTGNSEATHLHLEIRASRSADFTGWATIRSGVMDPVALFRR